MNIFLWSLSQRCPKLGEVNGEFSNCYIYEKKKKFIVDQQGF